MCIMMCSVEGKGVVCQHFAAWRLPRSSLLAAFLEGSKIPIFPDPFMVNHLGTPFGGET